MKAILNADFESRISMKVILGIALASMLVTTATAQDSPFRKELKRGDLTGTNMEVMTSITEIKPGEVSTLHIHHGDESYYFLEGGTIELPDGRKLPVPTGAVGFNVRDVPHGEYEVIGDKTIAFNRSHRR